jgi:PAS domain S-box-containing protein
MTGNRITVLLIEDNPGDVRLLRETLREAEGDSILVEDVGRLQAGLVRLLQGGIDVVLLDLSLPDSQGLETLAAVRARTPRLPVVVLTGFDDEETAVKAVREGAQDYLVKGRFDGSLLARAVRYGIERKRADEALRASEERFRSLVKNSFVGIFIVRNGRIVYRNPEQERLFGAMPEEFEVRRFQDAHPDDAEKFGEFCDAVASDPPRTIEMELRFFPYGKKREGANLRWVHCRTSPMEYEGKGAVVVNMVDVTRAKEMEQIAMTREKMSSLGHVATGIAHEIRNPLSGINIHLSALEKLLEDGDSPVSWRGEEVKGILEQIQSASERIESIVKKVLDFARPSPPRLEIADLNRAIEDAIDFSRTTFRKSGITLDRSGITALPMSYADSSLIVQVVMNLIANAVQAMECTQGPRIIGLSSAVQDGRIVICVSDSGPGIPPALREKIFDPFYTTRKEGYGIGLSFSHRVISDHGGGLKVDTSRWGGAEFRIEIPLREGKNPSGTPIPAN